MSKKYLFFAMATVALASCSQEETIEMSKGRTIDFRPTTEYMSRGTAIEVETDFKSFNVAALDAVETSILKIKHGQIPMDGLHPVLHIGLKMMK